MICVLFSNIAELTSTTLYVIEHVLILTLLINVRLTLLMNLFFNRTSIDLQIVAQLFINCGFDFTMNRERHLFVQLFNYVNEISL